MNDLPFLGFWGELKRPLSVLAPMEDVTDWVFRTVLSRIAPPQVYYTEFASADRIAAGKKDALGRLSFDPVGHWPLVVQIWGTSPENYRKAIALIRTLKPAGIDINMGCPQDSITRKGAGSAHILNHSLSREVILAAQEACGDTRAEGPVLPLSIKTRMGWDKVVSEEWLSFLLGFKPAALTLHARTAVQQSEGQADWSQFRVLRRLRDELSPATLVLGNGDVVDGAGALVLTRDLGLDGVMIGRGLFRDPLLFRQIRAAFGDAFQAPGLGSFVPGPGIESFGQLGLADRAKLALEHLVLYESWWGQGRNFEIMKKYFKIYLAGAPALLSLREDLNALHENALCQEGIRQFLRNLQTQA